MNCPSCGKPADVIHERSGEDGLGNYWLCDKCEREARAAFMAENGLGEKDMERDL